MKAENKSSSDRQQQGNSSSEEQYDWDADPAQLRAKLDIVDNYENPNMIRDYLEFVRGQRPQISASTHPILSGDTLYTVEEFLELEWLSDEHQFNSWSLVNRLRKSNKRYILNMRAFELQLDQVVQTRPELFKGMMSEDYRGPF
jgi:hypothetical protein